MLWMVLDGVVDGVAWCWMLLAGVVGWHYWLVLDGVLDGVVR